MPSQNPIDNPAEVVGLALECARPMNTIAASGVPNPERVNDTGVESSGRVPVMTHEVTAIYQIAFSRATISALVVYPGTRLSAIMKTT